MNNSSTNNYNSTTIHQNSTQIDGILNENLPNDQSFFCTKLLGQRCGTNMIFKEIQPNSLSESLASNSEICWLRCQCENANYIRKGEKCVEIQQQQTNNPTTIGLEKNLVSYLLVFYS